MLGAGKGSYCRCGGVSPHSMNHQHRLAARGPPANQVACIENFVLTSQEGASPYPMRSTVHVKSREGRTRGPTYIDGTVGAGTASQLLNVLSKYTPCLWHNIQLIMSHHRRHNNQSGNHTKDLQSNKGHTTAVKSQRMSTIKWHFFKVLPSKTQGVNPPRKRCPNFQLTRKIFRWKRCPQHVWIYNILIMSHHTRHNLTSMVTIQKPYNPIKVTPLL